MKNKIFLSIYGCIFSAVVFSFTGPAKTIDDKEILNIVEGSLKYSLFNYTVKMAAVDTRPYNPNDLVVYPPTTLFNSRCTDSAAHGGKVFKLFVKNDSNYAYDITQPAGQIIVMQTWLAEKTDSALASGKTVRISKTEYLKPAAAQPYFIMYKPEAEKNFATDNGWIYAAVSANGKKVLQKGLVASCRKCHAVSKTDRMWGAK